MEACLICFTQGLHWLLLDTVGLITTARLLGKGSSEVLEWQSSYLDKDELLHPKQFGVFTREFK